VPLSGGAENVELCNDEQKATIAAHQKKTAADLTKEVEANEAKLKKADKDLEVGRLYKL
jgi:hypothetical protein